MDEIDEILSISNKLMANHPTQNEQMLLTVSSHTQTRIHIHTFRILMNNKFVEIKPHEMI